MKNEDSILYCGVFCDKCFKKGLMPARAKMLHQIADMTDSFDSCWEQLNKVPMDSFVCEAENYLGLSTGSCLEKHNVALCVECEEYPCEHISALEDAMPLIKKETSTIKYPVVGYGSSVKNSLPYSDLRLIQANLDNEDDDFEDDF